ncbi:MAG TPA: carboxymuconolactone decarboxylase family protein [Gemmatimonadaceae bacterium]|jgi:AhpD family alkylhydroperoxidase
MKSRIDVSRVSPQSIRSLIALGAQVETSGLEPSLLRLVEMRASQINGCAYCLDMHSKDARAAGEKEQRLYVLDAWRETSLYSDRERAALAWTESVTRVADTHVPDDVYEEVSRHFSEQELVALTLAVVAINGFNRLNVAFRVEGGSYQPGMFKNLLKTDAKAAHQR